MGYVIGWLLLAGIWTGFLPATLAAQSLQTEPGYIDSFRSFARNRQNQYQVFRTHRRNEYSAFAEDILAKWEDFRASTAKIWVVYDDSLTIRSSVDFEAGSIEIEALIEADQDSAEVLAKPRIEAHLKRLLAEEDLDGNAILEGQVILDTAKPPAAAIDSLIETSAIEKKPVTAKDGINRVKVSATFALVPDHLRRRAERYVPIVQRHSRRFGLDAALIFAIIHTESFFNPFARSSAPAYGLMQLVPHSGSRAAYQYVYGEDRVLLPMELYDPERNIELGCGYLAFLRKETFRAVEEDDKAILCVVAGYNTGPGNVSRAFTGRKAVQQAIPIIRQMKAGALYRHLLENLPYGETRDYLHLVMERKPLYVEWRTE
jgi:membrane-bound lytic murein transglycosylase C